MWQWPADTLIEFVRCETGKPIDDVMVGGSHQGIAYINAKLSPTASQSKKSDLASALAQFTRQYISNVNQITGRDSGERTPNRVLDRFVLIISSGSSNSITKIFPRVLTRLRPDLPSQKLSLDDAAQTAKEREILSKVKTHLQREWMDAAKTAPTETEIINLLRLVHVEVLDVDEDGINEREAKRILRASILRNPEQADLVWNTLLKICTLWSSDRNGGSRSDVEQQLLQAGIALKSPRSFQEDIERLKK